MYHLVDWDFDRKDILWSSDDKSKLEDKKKELEKELEQYRASANDAYNRLHYELTNQYGSELVKTNATGIGVSGGGDYYKYKCSIEEQYDFTKRFWESNPLPKVQYMGRLYIEESPIL